MNEISINLVANTWSIYGTTVARHCAARYCVKLDEIVALSRAFICRDIATRRIHMQAAEAIG